MRIPKCLHIQGHQTTLLRNWEAAIILITDPKDEELVQALDKLLPIKLDQLVPWQTRPTWWSIVVASVACRRPPSSVPPQLLHAKKYHRPHASRWLRWTGCRSHWEKTQSHKRVMARKDIVNSFRIRCIFIQNPIKNSKLSPGTLNPNITDWSGRKSTPILFRTWRWKDTKNSQLYSSRWKKCY